MTRPPLRALCLQALIEWEKKSLFAETIVDRLATRHALDPRDRAFLNTAVLGVLRNLLLLDHRISHLREGKLRSPTRMLLRLGLYQIFHMRVPDHAAVGETVALARSARERGLINAVLRRAARERDAMLAAETFLPLAVRASIPDFLVDRWTARFGEKATGSLCDWMNRPAPIFLRANLLHPDSVDVLPAAADPLPADARFFEVDAVPADWIARGLAYAQDPATAIACDQLDPAPGETVLDACAAPGGKTALLAEKMRDTGRIVACEKSPRRLARLRDNLARLRVTNTDTLLLDWRALSEENRASLPAAFDAILVDAPCTNTGVMRRRVDLRWRLHERSFAEMARLQCEIVRHCLPLLRPGGRLVYSTCSLEPEENRDLVGQLLAAHPDLRLIEEREALPFRDAMDGAYAALLHRAP